MELAPGAQNKAINTRPTVQLKQTSAQSHQKQGAYIAQRQDGHLLDDTDAQEDDQWVRHRVELDPPSKRKLSISFLPITVYKTKETGRREESKCAMQSRCCARGCGGADALEQTVCPKQSSMAAPPAGWKPKLTYFNYDGGRGEPIRIGAFGL